MLQKVPADAKAVAGVDPSLKRSGKYVPKPADSGSGKPKFPVTGPGSRGMPFKNAKAARAAGYMRGDHIYFFYIKRGGAWSKSRKILKSRLP